MKRLRFPARSQLWLGVTFVFLLQFGLIFWLGQRQPVKPRAAAPAPGLQLVGSGSLELLELLDPTLLALPHEKGFSGAGWLIPPAQEIHPFEWSEPPRWLPLAVTRLGTHLEELSASSSLDLLPVLARPELEPPQVHTPDKSLLPEKSSLQLGQDLAGRRLLTKPELPSWPHSELVSNSVVQVLVDAEGVPFSFTLLERSGHEPADRQALREARRARFEPLGRDHTRASDLAWGTMVFRWQTVPATVAVLGEGARP